MMREFLLAGAAMLSALLFATIAATTPVPPSGSWNGASQGYGVSSPAQQVSPS